MDTSMLGRVCIRSHTYMLEGKWMLMKNGMVLIVVNSGDPIEDVDFDTIVMSEKDYDDVNRILDSNSPARKSHGTT